MHSRNGGKDLGSLKVTVDGNEVWGKTGEDKGNMWNLETVKLGASAGKSVTISFSATRASSFRGDIGLDDVVIFPGSAGGGGGGGATTAAPSGGGTTAAPATTAAPTPAPGTTAAPTPAPGTTAAPTPAPGPTGKPTALHQCVDSLVFEDDQGNTCLDYRGKTCPDNDEIKRHCAFSCNACLPTQLACKDDDSYVDPIKGQKCTDWSPFECTGYSLSDELITSCPVSCGACEVNKQGKTL
jgi:hypothetical protein